MAMNSVNIPAAGWPCPSFGNVYLEHCMIRLNQEYWMREQMLRSLMTYSSFPVVIYYPVSASRVYKDQRKRPLNQFWTTEVLNSERRRKVKKQRILAEKLGRKLKRLQKIPSRKMRLDHLGEQGEIKLRWKRYRMMKTGRPTTSVPDPDNPRCGLWNCDGKRPRVSNRKKSLRRSRSLRSVLSNFSVRSRTPIVFRKSPVRDKTGFAIDNI